MTDILAPANSLQIYRGASKTIQLTVKDDAGVAFNLTGWKVIFTVKKMARPSYEVLIRKTSEVVEQISITSAADGQVEIYLLPADTSTLCPLQYVYDVWIFKDDEAYPVVPPTVLEILSSVLTP